MNTTIIAKNKDHLKRLIQTEIFNNGLQCDLNHIDVSNIVDMSSLFKESKFNGNISRWNVSNVENMGYMFHLSKFRGDISQWNVSQVNNMEEMFSNSYFNGDICNWNISNVKSMKCMFYFSYFNQNISNWDVTNVKNMNEMFRKSVFIQDLTDWKTYSATIYCSSNIFTECSAPIPYWHYIEDKEERIFFLVLNIMKPIVMSKNY